MPRYAPAPGLKIAELDDGAAVFSPSSWETHLLNASAAAVLGALIEAPRSEADEAAYLTELLDVDSRPQAAEHAVRILADLRRLHLIDELA